MRALRLRTLNTTRLELAIQSYLEAQERSSSSDSALINAVSVEKINDAESPIPSVFARVFMTVRFWTVFRNLKHSPSFSCDALSKCVQFRGLQLLCPLLFSPISRILPSATIVAAQEKTRTENRTGLFPLQPAPQRRRHCQDQRDH